MVSVRGLDELLAGVGIADVERSREHLGTPSAQRVRGRKGAQSELLAGAGCRDAVADEQRTDAVGGFGASHLLLDDDGDEGVPNRGGAGDPPVWAASMKLCEQLMRWTEAGRVVRRAEHLRQVVECPGGAVTPGFGFDDPGRVERPHRERGGTNGCV